MPADSDQLDMEATSLENTFTCQPQQRNMHGRIFGGFLMRRAFELAHATTYLFAGCRPRTGKSVVHGGLLCACMQQTNCEALFFRFLDAVEIGGITFRRPVEVGDLIKFKSWVTHTWQSSPGQVSVVCEHWHLLPAAAACPCCLPRLPLSLATLAACRGWRT